SQRASLRRPPGPQQGRDQGEVRRGPVHGLAPQLRHPAAGARRQVRVLPGRRPPLRRTGEGPAHRVPPRRRQSSRP
ncbi:hypothetical protein KR044_011533, partial [Drosophila immigrans]